MKLSVCFLFAILAFGFANANVIDWDALNGDLYASVYRPVPYKRPAPPTNTIEQEDFDQFQPPVYGENWYPAPIPEPENLNVNVDSEHENSPKLITEPRPYDPLPVPPVMEEPKGPPSPQTLPPKDTETKNESSKPRPNKGIHLSSGNVVVNAKPLDVVDGVVVPTPKYPPGSKHDKEFDIYYY